MLDATRVIGANEKIYGEYRSTVTFLRGRNLGANDGIKRRERCPASVAKSKWNSWRRGSGKQLGKTPMEDAMTSQRDCILLPATGQIKRLFVSCQKTPFHPSARFSPFFPFYPFYIFFHSPLYPSGRGDVVFVAATRGGSSPTRHDS